MTDKELLKMFGLYDRSVKLTLEKERLEKEGIYYRFYRMAEKVK